MGRNKNPCAVEDGGRKGEYFRWGKNQLSGVPTMILQVTELSTQETCLLSRLDGTRWGIASSCPTGVLP